MISLSDINLRSEYRNAGRDVDRRRSRWKEVPYFLLVKGLAKRFFTWSLPPSISCSPVEANHALQSLRGTQIDSDFGSETLPFEKTLDSTAIQSD